MRIEKYPKDRNLTPGRIYVLEEVPGDKEYFVSHVYVTWTTRSLVEAREYSRQILAYMYS